MAGAASDAAPAAMTTWPNCLLSISVAALSSVLLGCRSADLDSSVFADFDRIARLHGLEELVAEEVDCDDPTLVPDEGLCTCSSGTE